MQECMLAFLRYMANKLLQVGKQLLQGNFNALKSISDPVYEVPLDPGNYRRDDWSGWNFFTDNFTREIPFVYRNNASAGFAYENCPPLNSIINRKAQAHINGKVYIMNTQGKAKGKESDSIYANKIRNLFNKPNPIETGDIFHARLKVYTQVFGFCLVLPILPYGYTDPVDAQSMWIIPPYMVDIEETQKLFYQTDLTGIIGSIKLRYKGVTSNIDVKNVWIFKDFTPSMNSYIFPESRTCSVKQPINNIIGAYTSRGELIDYAGAQGIFSPNNDNTGPILLTDEDKEKIQQDARRYGIKRKQWKYIFSPKSITWQQVGRPTKDLMLFEEIQDATREVAISYGFPHFLLGLKDATYENQAQAEKYLYQNTIIPESQSTDCDWNRIFKTEEKLIKIERDFSEIPCLQEDMKAKAETRATLGRELSQEFKDGFITYNRVLELLGEDQVEGGNVYYQEWIQQNPNYQQQTSVIPIAQAS